MRKRHPSFRFFFALCFSLAVLSPLADAVSESVLGTHCRDLLRKQLGKGRLLVIVVGGRATGERLTHEAREMGFKTIHVYPSKMDSSIIRSFKDTDYDFPPLVFDETSHLSAVAQKIREIAVKQGLEIAGAIPGMDYGTQASNILSKHFVLPANSVEGHAWLGHKGALNDFLALRGVPVAETFSASVAQAVENAQTYPYPIIVKPDAGFASIGTGVARYPGELLKQLEMLVREAEVRRLATDTIILQKMLYPRAVPFANTISARMPDGSIKRILTGVWIDERRGDTFPLVVWDRIFMMPPRSLLNDKGRQVFDALTTANLRTLNASEFHVGSSHLEFMSPVRDFSEADEVYPTDLNARLPGLDSPSLEAWATGVNPYQLDILARTNPGELADFPEQYTQWNGYVAMIFLRANRPGTFSQRGWDWMQSRLVKPGRQPAQDGRAYFSRLLMPKPGAPVVKTIDGVSMQGTFLVHGPNLQSLENLYEEIREKEAKEFFLD